MIFDWSWDLSGGSKNCDDGSISCDGGSKTDDGGCNWRKAY